MNELMKKDKFRFIFRYVIIYSVVCIVGIVTLTRIFYPDKSDMNSEVLLFSLLAL